MADRACDLKKTLEERFWSKVDRRGPDECWEWTGHRANNYGSFWVAHGIRMVSSRVALVLTLGMLDRALMVCHSCDNPPCCNPRHLFTASQAKNLSDMRTKGRGVAPPRNVHLFGEAIYCHKLTSSEVDMIRLLAALDDTHMSIAEKFNVKRQTIGDITTGRTWRQ